MSTLVRWTPRSRHIASPLDRFFDDLWSNLPENGRSDVTAPALDIIEREAEVEVRVNLPGVSPDNVAIEFEKGVLSIATLVDANQSDEDAAQPKYTHRERFDGSFRRTLRVPESIDTEAAEATFEHGVLYLTLPKKPEAQPIRIPVKAGK